VLRDAAGAIVRVTLGPGEVDCRPTYIASPDDWIVKAVVAAEDGSFWEHAGVRPLSICRAFVQNLFSRRRVSGASTLTMQAVRLIHPHPKSYLWKAKEAVMALKAERVRDKRWILSQYLNRAPFGSNFYGIEAASSGWFGKSPHALDVGEAALLAGMLRAPSRYRPDRHYANAVAIRNRVLERMHACGYIDEARLAAERAIGPALSPVPRPYLHPRYTEAALAALPPRAENPLGDYTTALDRGVQETCERLVYEASEKGKWSAAAVVLRVDSGAVAAVACTGENGETAHVDFASRPRPAGSTLKPFLAARALDCGRVAPDEKLLDAPVVYKGYRPANFDGRYRGPVSLADSLVLSLNIPFVRLLDRLGTEDFTDTLGALGCGHLARSDETGLGLAIGNGEVTLVELAGAYAVLARGGLYRKPTYLATQTNEAVRVFSPAASWWVSDALAGKERSAAAFGHVADVKLPKCAWKTGTSAGYRDAWTVVWNADWVVAVWCGHAQGGFGDTSLTGLGAAAPLAWSIMRTLCPGGNGRWMKKPADLVGTRVCPRTGLSVGPDCPAAVAGHALAGAPAVPLCRTCLKKYASCVDSESLVIARPEDGSTLARPRGGNGKVVFSVLGSASESVLYWFMDGVSIGESSGSSPFVYEPPQGEHVFTCADAFGRSASVSVAVRDE